MNTQRNTRIFKTPFILIVVLMMVIGTVGNVAAQTPDPWEPFCSGSGALVIQEESNTGDGVAMSAEDAVENWACGDTDLLVGYVEPWDGNRDRDRSDFPDKFNADSMVVGTAEQLLDFAISTGLDNGSYWLVDESYANHPLVVFADDVTNADSLGLNPMENQIDLDRMGWVRGRANDMYGVQKYVSEYAETDRLAQRMIQLGWATVETSAPVVEEEPILEEPVAEPTGMTAEQASADCDAIVPDPDNDGFYVCAPEAEVVAEPTGMTAEQASADCDAIVPDPDNDGFYVCAPEVEVPAKTGGLPTWAWILIASIAIPVLGLIIWAVRRNSRIRAEKAPADEAPAPAEEA